MIRLVPLVLLLMVQEPLPSKGKGGPTGTSEIELKVGEQARAFRLRVPEGLDAARPAPVVFVFHGKGGRKDFIPHVTGFDEHAVKNGYIVVYPGGLENEWELRDVETNRDLKFFDAMFEHITTRYNVDLRRVYATGMSMGGYFSNLLAARRSERIAAIAPHSGGLGPLAFTGIRARRKYPVLIIHGDEDRVVKVEQGRSSRDAYLKDGHPVEYVEVKGMGHAWAKSENITDRIWKFFMDHAMK